MILLSKGLIYMKRPKGIGLHVRKVYKNFKLVGQQWSILISEERLLLYSNTSFVFIDKRRLTGKVGLSHRYTLYI